MILYFQKSVNLSKSCKEEIGKWNPSFWYVNGQPGH